jgi:hypothetical protein
LGGFCPPLALLKKDAFRWNDVASDAFARLKQAVTTTPVLALPDFNKMFILECDASGLGIGAVLMQECRPIAFTNKALSPQHLSLTVYDKEMLAIIHAVTKWRPYLIGRHFQIRTDHRSLKHILEQRISSIEQHKWVTKLLGYDFEIIYKKGTENLVADALSRIPEHSEVFAISIPACATFDHIKKEQQEDPELKKVIQKLEHDPSTVPHFSWHTDHLRYKGRIVLASHSSHKSIVLQECHDSPSAGHSGFLRTYRRITRVFYWKGMKADIKQFVAECETCQRQKGETVASPELLQPLTVPEEVWTDISMDFIDGLPPLQGKTTILVVVDRLTKYAHFCPLAHPYTAIIVAQVFVDNIVKLHGIPQSIVSDRDKVFTSNFWKELFRLQGTQLRMSTAYHPQTDGQTEVVNRCLENYLRCFVGDKPKEWTRWLSWAEWWYNTTYHSAIKMTPFEAVYGRAPPIIPTYNARSSSVDELDRTLQDRTKVLRILKDHLHAAQARMKQQADKHRSEREFEVGDWVFLRLQPYRQISVNVHPSNKLSPRFYGPYKVLERIGYVAYRLDLPPESKIHPIFHVSCLKKKLGERVFCQQQLPDITSMGDVRIQLTAILDRRMVKWHNKVVVKVLVQWAHLPKEDATWEPYETLKARFPEFINYQP